MNVLLITTDEHSYAALGCNGNAFLKTPNIDRLAREGTSLTRHTCSSPVCTPARVSMLTGQYPRSHGAVMVGYDFDAARQTLPHWLATAGYRCAIAGKAHFEAELNGHAAGHRAGDPYYGFHEAYLTEDIQHGAYLDWVRANHPHWYDEVRRNTHEDDAHCWGITDGRYDACYKSKLPEEVHASHWIADRSRDFIRRQAAKGERFFLWTSFVDPHHPWNPVEPFASMYDPADLPEPLLEAGAHGGPTCGYNDGSVVPVQELKRLQAMYYGMISHIDMQVGRILDELESAGVLDQTAIIFTSDHGDHNGNRRMIRKFGGLYDDILRVPMIVRAPGIAAAGASTCGLSQHEDIAPTILSMLNVPVPESVQGVSLLPALKGVGNTGRQFSYFEAGDDSTAGIEGPRWKCICYDQGKHHVLTDLQADPREMVDRSGDVGCRPVLQELRLGLCDWMLRTPPWHPPKLYGY